MSKLLPLSIGALGVVYGDIGTSPLYAINEIYAHFHDGISTSQVLGFTSLVVWAVTIIVSFKYVIYVLRADNDGEGGVFALYALLTKIHMRGHAIIASLLVLAAGLLLGDGIITPAISVISAVEGLKVVTNTFNPYVVPITVSILTCLFLIQKKGTSSIGKFFGPIIIVWFISIGLLGGFYILQNPLVLKAFNPVYAINFLVEMDLHTVFIVLGSVMLVVTGGEAMYADMGHFGRLPIRISWFSIVYLSLLLNYLGQGAYILSGSPIVAGNIFYSMVPKMYLVPMVILATAATIIASQALISGAFSLITQAVSLGLLPYTKVIHTHHDHEGQIYVPAVNWLLYIGCVALVVGFGSSARLASAYGLAVSGVMFVTSLAMIFVATHIWHWRLWQASALFVTLAVIDSMFLSANTLKLLDGGYVPLGIGVLVLTVMRTWEWGRAQTIKTFRSYPTMTIAELIRLKKSTSEYLPKTIVIMNPIPIHSVTDKVPLIKQLYLDRYGLLSKHLIFLTVVIKRQPHVHRNRYEIHHLYMDKKKGSITAVNLNFGFMEEPNVESVLEGLAKHHEIAIDEDHKKWLIHTMHERIFSHFITSRVKKFRLTIYGFLLNNTKSADEYFGLGDNQPLTIETVPVSIR